MSSFYATFDEKELLHRLYTGDEKAFTEIYNQYWKKLFFVAAHKLQNLSEAEEIVQEIFLQLWKRRTVINVECLSSYLSVSLKYCTINVLAKRAHQYKYHQFKAYLTSLPDCSTEQTLQFEELKDQLAKETAKLPEKCRLVFQLSREKGYSHKRIAVTLGISEKTVESHLSKAIRSLRAGLSHVLSILIFWFLLQMIFFI